MRVHQVTDADAKSTSRSSNGLQVLFKTRGGRNAESLSGELIANALQVYGLLSADWRGGGKAIAAETIRDFTIHKELRKNQNRRKI